MAPAASDLEPAAEPHVEESSSVGDNQEEAAAAGEVELEKEAAEGEGEEEGECGFCLFMKGGGCKEAFVAWEECVEAAEKEGSDIVERCFQATSNLKKCMDAHAEYYAPVLQAEAAVTTAADDADKKKGEGSAPSPATQENTEAAVTESTATADEKEVVAEKAVSSPSARETKKEEAVVEKVESMSLSN